jgi:hypothetical protein
MNKHIVKYIVKHIVAGGSGDWAIGGDVDIGRSASPVASPVRTQEHCAVVHTESGRVGVAYVWMHLQCSGFIFGV